VTPQGFLGNFHGDLEGARVVEGDLGDAREQGDFVAGGPAESVECHLVGIPGDGDLHDGLAHEELCDNRSFGLLRKAVDGIHPVLDLGDDGVEVRTRDRLDAEDAGSFHRNGLKTIDIRDALDLLLGSHTEGFLDLLGRCARVFDGDADDLYIDAGEFLLVNLGQGHDAPENQHHHQEVGGDGIPNEPGDDGIHEPRSTRAITGSTCMPSTATCSGDVQIRSPSASWVRISTSSRSIRMISTARLRRRFSRSTTRIR